MKKIVVLSVLFLSVISFTFAAKNNSGKPQQAAAIAKVEVYYFHFTRRCATCNAVENESLKAIKLLYPTQFKSGKITFKSVNLDDKTSKAFAAKYKVEGQSLLVITKDARIDLTDAGFMYARSNPEKLKKELKKGIDPLL
jgi:hypothetical protein